jgi:hypothetical protein
MTLERTVDIPETRRIFLDLPPEFPRGRAKLAVTVISESEPAASPRKLSERFAGALRLSQAKYDEFQAAVRQGRNEWNERS